jgi:uncharacterized protein YggT (Ycf19 family)
MTYRVPGDGGVPGPERVIVEHPVETPVAREVVEQPVVATASPIDVLRRVVWLVFGVLQALIVLRIVLLLLGANHANDLVAFILGVTDPFVEPFRGMFRLDEVGGASGSILDVAAIVALIAWTLVEALVLAIVGLADRRARVV